MGTRNSRTCKTGEHHKEDSVMKTQWRHRIAATVIIVVLCLVPLPAIASHESVKRDPSEGSFLP